MQAALRTIWTSLPWISQFTTIQDDRRDSPKKFILCSYVPHSMLMVGINLRPFLLPFLLSVILHHHNIIVLVILPTKRHLGCDIQWAI
ncbi:hypothetical protein E2C01_000172 [Portunus trituberculatus]|uniref:Uncharacterized protein n=1 Tax=Portunus trituberculatus TaxID=210409 RepID=A0A5B7CEF5_PORTR|nr:hypothetical protein [Portunus trituberculatus]